jgi:L-rhamnose mutarotase
LACRRDEPVNRYGSVFRIRPELAGEYKEAHDRIWPEMAAAIRESGIRSYSLFLRPSDGTVFSCFECPDAEAAFRSLRKTQVFHRWQKAMDRFFVKSNPAIEGPQAEDLPEVFHLD